MELPASAERRPGSFEPDRRRGLHSDWRVAGWQTSPLIRQFEAVAFGPSLAARGLGPLVAMVLAAHAWKDDDLGTRRIVPVALFGPRVPRTEIKNHCH